MRIGRRQRDLQHPHGRRPVALTREIERAGIVEPQHPGDIAPRIMERILFAERAQKKRLIGNAQPALGTNQRRHHPRLRQCAARRSVEVADDLARQIEPFMGGKAPDQIVFGLPRSQHLRAKLQRPDRDFVDPALAVAPCGPARIFEQLGAAPFERQARRRDEAAHPCREQVVCTDETSGPVGDRNRNIVMIDCGAQHRPIGRRRLAHRGRRKQTPREDHAARRERESGKETGGKHRVAGRPEQ